MMSETLFHPKQNSIVVSLMPKGAADFRVRYGGSRAELTRFSARVAGRAATRVDILLSGLEAGTRYFYQVECAEPATDDWARRPEIMSFNTEPSPDSTANVVVWGDAHTAKIALTKKAGNCNTNPTAENRVKMNLTMQNILRRHEERRFGFLMSTGDEASTLGLKDAPVPCFVDGLKVGKDNVGVWGACSNDPASDCRHDRQCGLGNRCIRDDGLENARARYNQTMKILHPVVSKLPWFQTLGNHEAESSWGDPSGTCGFYSAPNPEGIDDVTESTRAARLEYFRNPVSDYKNGVCSGGSLCGATRDCPVGEICSIPNPAGNWFAFPWASSYWIVLDNFADGKTGLPPMTAEEWKLGTHQSAFLDAALAESARLGKKWIFVVMHHLFGGVHESNKCYWYARGGICSVDRFCSSDRDRSGPPCTRDSDCGAAKCEPPVCRSDFNGDQSIVQAKLAASVPPAGAVIVLYGHDHLDMWGEKLDRSGRTGVYYVMAGQPHNYGAGWTKDREFQLQMDWDENGHPDWDNDGLGVGTEIHAGSGRSTQEAGFIWVEIQGRTRVVLHKIITEQSEGFPTERNDTELFDYVIPQPK